MHDPMQLPQDLPIPVQDGLAAHLLGLPMPVLELPSTHGGVMRVDQAPPGFKRLIIYAYPLTGLPGTDSPEGWEQIPGARGCTPESCSFRDLSSDFAANGAFVVGLSTQSTHYQQEAVDRLHLPYPLLSDASLQLTQALKLPTFQVELRPLHDGGGLRTLLKRLTLIVSRGMIENVFYPVFPPDRHADEVLSWVQKHRY